ncbi:DNA repair protein RadC [Pelomonas sp. KK5]|uniref:RadC family protein n=1 Tax=Pelomonas sp. KK5 TaxID=1855730 RepID=UPI00097CB768|nr:DNA repair protein RadC [Pelomonas sp. KK5]
MPLQDLPPDARPREKLLARGPQALADAELLALLLRTGLPGQGVLQLAQALLDQFGGWQGLLSAGMPELSRIKGLGPAKRAEIAAVLEIARRALQQQLVERPILSSPEAVRSFLQLKLGAHPHEVFAVLFLDSQLRLIAFDEMFNGTLHSTTVHPREIVKRALQHGAAAVMLAHNHPSGVAEPSQADVLLTRRLIEALSLVDVRVMDHLVVCAGSVASLVERGMI